MAGDGEKADFEPLFFIQLGRRLLAPAEVQQTVHARDEDDPKQAGQNDDAFQGDLEC